MNSIYDEAVKYLGTKQGSATHKALVDEWNKLYGKANNLTMYYDSFWCAMFSSLICLKCGFNNSQVPLSIGCLRLIAQAEKLGLWVEDDTYRPKKNDLILYEWSDTSNYANTDCNNDADHVGIVGNYISSDIFEVVEGNKGGCVASRQMCVNGRYIRGYIALSRLYETQPTNKESNYLEIAKRVIRGDYGNGTTRKKRLLESGYTIEEITIIQNIVNNLLK